MFILPFCRVIVGLWVGGLASHGVSTVQVDVHTYILDWVVCLPISTALLPMEPLKKYHQFWGRGGVNIKQ